MKTLHKLMFGCLALMVAMSMLFVSCSDDDDDDDDTTPASKISVTVKKGGTEVALASGKYPVTVSDADVALTVEAKYNNAAIATPATISYAVKGTADSNVAISNGTITIKSAHAAGDVTITASYKATADATAETLDFVIGVTKQTPSQDDDDEEDDEEEEVTDLGTLATATDDVTEITIGDSDGVAVKLGTDATLSGVTLKAYTSSDGTTEVGSTGITLTGAKVVLAANFTGVAVGSKIYIEASKDGKKSANRLGLTVKVVKVFDTNTESGPVTGTSATKTAGGLDEGDKGRVIAYSDGTFKAAIWWGEGKSANYKGLSGTYTKGENNAITLTPTGRPKKGEGVTFTGTDTDFSTATKWEEATCYTGAADADKKTIAVADYTNITDAEWGKLNNFAAYAYLDGIAVLAKAGDDADAFVAPVADDLNATVTSRTTYKANTVAANGVLRLVVCKSQECFGPLEVGNVSYKVTGGGTIATTSAKYKVNDTTSVDISSFTNIDDVGLIVTGSSSPWSVGTVNNSFGVVKYTAPNSIPTSGITIEATYVNKNNGATAKGTITITATASE